MMITVQANNKESGKKIIVEIDEAITMLAFMKQLRDKGLIDASKPYYMRTATGTICPPATKFQEIKEKTFDIIQDVLPVPPPFLQLGIFVIDGSGSMKEGIVNDSTSPSEAVDKALKNTIMFFKEGRKRQCFSFSVVAFGDSAKMVLSPQKVEDIDNKLSFIATDLFNNGKGSGTTNIASGLAVATELAKVFLSQKKGNLIHNVVVVVLSDGMCHHEQETRAIADNLKQIPGIEICCCHLETGIKETKAVQLLKDISNHYETVYDQKLLANFLSILRQEPIKGDFMAIQLSLNSCHSVTPKRINRDKCITIRNDKVVLNGIAVADGVGNNERVEEAAEFVVCFMKDQIENLISIEDLNLETLFNDCKVKFEKKFNKSIKNDQFGTTLILAIEYAFKETKKIKIAYVGNGAIWHIKGNFNHFTGARKFPWNCINYLNPHSVEEHGKEVLINCISLGAGNYSGPTIVDFSCDVEFGDIVMICTDGIYSYDQVVCSEDGFGEIWIQYGTKLQLFFSYLNNYFKQEEWNGETLSLMLYHYLKDLDKKNLLDDDATIGLVVSAKAMEYQKKILNGTGNKD